MKINVVTLLFGLVALTVAAPVSNVETKNDEIENTKRDNEIDNAYRRYTGGHWVGFSPENKKRDNEIDNVYKPGGTSKRDNEIDNAYRRYLGGHWVGFTPGDKKRNWGTGGNDEEE